MEGWIKYPEHKLADSAPTKCLNNGFYSFVGAWYDNI